MIYNKFELYLTPFIKIIMKIFDHIHGYINICKSAKKILDTPEFQRLRNVKQLGCVYYVFPSASHNRFEHSLGVYHLTRLYMDKLNSMGDVVLFDQSEYKLISIAALIHDLGHGPFSHLFDNFVTDSEHEYRSIEIFKTMNSYYNLNYSQEEIDFMYEIIHPSNEYKEKEYLYQIVSNKNGIDTDRFDYMLRDMKMTGLENPYNFDYNFILNMMDHTKIHENKIVYNEDIKFNLEMFFQTRFRIYKKVCNHKTVKSLELMMGDILLELDTSFHINESIQKCDWGKFCTFSDTIVHCMDFIKINETAYALYDRIKYRNIYKLIKEKVVKDINNIGSEFDMYLDNDRYIINKTTIRYYSDEKPILIGHDNEIVNYDFFNTGYDIHLIKVYEI